MGISLLVLLIVIAIVIGVSMSHQSATSTSATRLATVRRLYFYLVALISFIVGLVGLDGLLSSLSDAWLGTTGVAIFAGNSYLRENIASNGGLLLVAAPLFLLHWGYMQRRRHELEERSAALRKFFLYVASAVALGYALTNAHALLLGLAKLAFGQSLAQSEIWPAAWLHHSLMIGAAAALQIYLHTVLVGDGDYGSEVRLAGTWRRLYQTAAGLVGLAVVIFGGATILETGLRALVGLTSEAIGVGWWRTPLSNGIALVLVGGVLARINWQRWLQITTTNPDEAKTPLRRFYLYAAVVIGALTTLIPAAGLLYEVLNRLFGGEFGSWNEWLERFIEPLAYLPIGILVWLWYWQIVRREADAYGESNEGATVRRLYYYAVAAAGLSLVWFGAVDILQAILDWLLVINRDGGRIWAEPLANGLSLLIVGAPIWSIHWRTVQSVARQDNLEGARERGSGPRRVYLYGVALVGALLILFYLAQVVYRLLLLVLGDPNAALFSIETVDHIARSVIAAILWGVHLLAIRGDGQMATEASAAPLPDSGETRVALQKRIEQLEAELATARAALAKLEA